MTECLCPPHPHFICGSPNLQCYYIWRWGPEEINKVKWGHMWLGLRYSVLRGRNTKVFPLSCTQEPRKGLVTHSKKTECKLKRWHLAETKSARMSILDFWSSDLRENTFLLYLKIHCCCLTRTILVKLSQNLTRRLTQKSAAFTFRIESNFWILYKNTGDFVFIFDY